jgi:hypothetical protein
VSDLKRDVQRLRERVLELTEENDRLTAMHELREKTQSISGQRSQDGADWAVKEIEELQGQVLVVGFCGVACEAVCFGAGGRWVGGLRGWQCLLGVLRCIST